MITEDDIHRRQAPEAGAKAPAADAVEWQPFGELEPSRLPPEPRARVSVARVLAALLLVSLAGSGGALALALRRGSTAVRTTAAPWFAPYVDVTLTPTYAFQNPTANPVREVVLGFVVAARTAPCQPSWGDYYSLAQAQATLNLDERIAQLEQQGGEPVVSFGGEANEELAVSCTRLASLTTAYGSVVSRYHLSTVDFDVEGAALADQAANDRRARAVAALQRQMRARHRSLGVWLTVPVDRSGLQPAALAAVAAMLAAHVRLSGVNVLAMDFAPGEVVHGNMLAAVESALQASHGQLQALLAADGIHATAATAWRSLGVTVMIGENDVAGERFTVTDAHALDSFVVAHGLARVSMWSLNRDSQCGQVFAQVGVLSNTCSGVNQPPLAFTHAFSSLPGTVTAAVPTPTDQLVPTVDTPPSDDQAMSPYPIWKPTIMYTTGYKVVWHRAIYEAKWFSQNVAPDAFAATAAQTPWLLIGPVLPGARFPHPPALSPHTFPAWSPTTVYRAGARVSYSGYPYAARYYSIGAVPDATLPVSPQSPWTLLWAVPGEPAVG